MWFLRWSFDQSIVCHHFILIFTITFIIINYFFKAAVKDESSGILKYLGEDLQRHPENRCSSTDQCTQQVLKGSSVYIYVRNNMIS